MPTVVFRTLGCKQNQFDTQALRRHLEDRGLRLVSRAQEADWIILNTCAVTERALAKARGDVHRLRRLNPEAKIIALGCGARYAPQAFIAEGCLTASEPSLTNLGLFDPGLDLDPPHGFITAGKTRGFLRVQTGCNEACSYCIVPSLRGSAHSVPLEACVGALEDLVAQGTPEIVLTGTNIALWGRDLPGQPGLQDLVAALLDQIGFARLRLTSLEPHLVSPEVLQWCQDQPNLCRHLHFAFQSGSARVLGLMRRSQPSQELADSLKELAHRHPDFCLGSDVIAGFPGETEQDFQDTLSWIRSIPLSYLHVFPYSERIGTNATELPDKVPVKERLRRAAILRQLSAELKNDFIQSNRVMVQDVILMRTQKSRNMEGLASNYLRISFGKQFRPQVSRFNILLTDDSISSIHLQK